ncbi:hypothetical protein [Streptomyces sp. NPDC089799]|uniref:hypothetical protein n=1 Tax=Streptomyces sp. NPDC089799 TaxID=3155066 RepID=UPI00341D5851
MHPTRTTTTLVLGVAAAVSAVSGCVSVTPEAGAPLQPAAAPAAGVPPRHETRGGTGSAPVVVQAPALEALKAAPEGSGGGSDAAAPAPAAGEGGGGRETAPEGPAEPVPPVPDIPEPRTSADGTGAGRNGGRDGKGRHGEGREQGRDGKNGPRAREVEREVMKHLPMRPADVCALGRKHGHLQPDSPEARICDGVQTG